MRIRFGAPALPLVVVLCCVACAPAAPTTTGLSLADTKSPVQLLRNESVLRLPSDQVGTVESADESVGCGDESIRSWESTATITLAGAAATNPELAMTTLAASFEEDGWVVSPGNEREDDEQAVLTSGTSAAEIRLVASSTGSTPTITIEAAGPCVQTDGAESDEVTRLEVGAGE